MSGSVEGIECAPWVVMWQVTFSVPDFLSPLFPWMQVVGDQFGMGMDDTHMKIRGAPVLDEPALSPHQKMIADKLAVSELMSMAVVALPPVVKVTSVIHYVL